MARRVSSSVTCRRCDSGTSLLMTNCRGIAHCATCTCFMSVSGPCQRSRVCRPSAAVDYTHGTYGDPRRPFCSRVHDEDSCCVVGAASPCFCFCCDTAGTLRPIRLGLHLGSCPCLNAHTGKQSAKCDHKSRQKSMKRYTTGNTNMCKKLKVQSPNLNT